MSENSIVINEAYCVSLPDNKHLWQPLDDLNLGIKLLPAVDSRSNPKIYKDYGLSLCPADEAQEAYFSHSPGAVGCYLSHYEIWNKAFRHRNEWTLALEDDAKAEDVKDVLEGVKFKIPDVLKDQDVPKLIQLNKRTCSSKIPFFFNGTESYLFNYKAACSLLHLTYNMSYLKGAHREYFWNPEFNSYASSLKASDLNKDFSEKNCIIYAADKFIGHCAHENIPEERRLRISIIDVVGLTQGHEDGETTYSDVMSKKMTPYWKMSLQEFLDFKKHPNYKWWEK